MATFTNALAKANKAARNLTVGVVEVVGTHTVTTEGVGDVVQLFKVDENQMLVHFRVHEEGFVTAANTTKYGDGVVTDRYILSAASVAAGVKNINNPLAPYPYPSGGDTVDLVFGGSIPAVGSKVHFFAQLANIPPESLL